MKSYNINYEILDYEKYIKRINRIINNPNNVYSIIKQSPLGYSPCGFPIERYTIGNGNKHIVFMGGCHGNEIISVDFITQLMENIALKKGAYENTDISEFTFDFIPCQNPEGALITTYAIDAEIKARGINNDQDLEKFCFEYFKAYRSDDSFVINLNKLIRGCFAKHNIECNPQIITNFWRIMNEKCLNSDKPFTKDKLEIFLNYYFNQKRRNLNKYIFELCWNTYFKNQTEIYYRKNHLDMFSHVDIDCIPEIDDRHRLMKENLRKIYESNAFHYSTLANYFANSLGINLNDNNPYYYNIFKEKMHNAINQQIYGNNRDNSILKSIPGPLGMPSSSMDEPFAYSSENQALFAFLDSLNRNGKYTAFFNYHSSGGIIYCLPVNASQEVYTYNSEIANSYSDAVRVTYMKNGRNDSYSFSPKATQIVGVGDLLRVQYPASFLIELSKMGGNPIAPMGDRNGNYQITMEANLNAISNSLNKIMQLSKDNILKK